MAVVLQKPLYENLRDNIKFEELPADRGGNTILFLIYDYVPNPRQTGAYQLELDRVVGTSHSSLMTASLYQNVPSQDIFCETHPR